MLRRSLRTAGPLFAICLSTGVFAGEIRQLGEPPTFPTDTRGLIGSPQRESVTGGFIVNVSRREEVRMFFNTVYNASQNVPMQWTGDLTNCVPGTSSVPFQEAVLRRINYFRAMAGDPANIGLDPVYSRKAQQAALMMSANNTLNHFPPSSWTCYTAEGYE